MKLGLPNAGDRGFSLLEALIVLVILAMTVVMAVPVFRGQQTDAGVRKAAGMLLAAVHTARSDAMRTSDQRVVLVDVKRRVYWTSSADRHRLPATLAVSATVPPQEQLDAATVRLRFLPDGSSSGGVFELSERGLHATVTVDWLTGASSIAWRR